MMRPTAPSTQVLFPGGLPELETARLRLRALADADAEAIYEYARDPEVARFTLFEPHGDLEDARAFLKEVASGGQPMPWGLELKASGRVVGTVAVQAWDAESRCAEVGYALGRAFWGQGLMTEALEAVVDWLFREAAAERVQAHTLDGNRGSQALLQKVGFKEEGTLRRRILAKGRRHDVTYYGLLREEWGA